MAGDRRFVDCCDLVEADAGGAMRDEHLYAFVADARARTAAGVRRRTRWLQRQLREDTSFAALCRDLAAAAMPVEVTLADGRRRRGTVVGAEDGVVALRRGGDVTSYIATAAATAVRVLRVTDGQPAAGDPPAIHGGGTFADVLADIADRRDRVAVGTSCGRTYEGRLAGVGRDVVWFDDNGWYLRLETITDVTVGSAP